MLDLDLAPRIVGAAPFRNRRRHRGRDETLLRKDADQRVDHRLGHGEAEQRRIDADAGCVAFGDHLAVVHHDHCLGPPERRCRRLLEGMIERRLQLGVGGFDNGRTGNLRQQRRLFRRLQDCNVAPEQIGFIGSVQHDAAEFVMKRGATAEQACQRRLASVLFRTVQGCRSQSLAIEFLCHSGQGCG